MATHRFSRRTFAKATTLMAAGTAVGAFAGPLARRAVAAETSDRGGARQATGVRVGEMTSTSAIVWMRLTQAAIRNNQGLLIPGKTDKKNRKTSVAATLPTAQLEGACPGAAGKVRLRYAANEQLSDATTTDWVDVAEATDFTHKFQLSDLTPGTTYHFASETADPDGKAHDALRGQFDTAPAADAPAEVRFCIMTCQDYPDRGHPDGHAIYPAMQALRPHFTCLTGDLVYYDNDAPEADTPPLARFHWERMFSLPRLHEFTRQSGCYWTKDDHDTLKDDSFPGEKLGQLTFAEGQAIFRQQSPIIDATPGYRTIRWGRDLQIWIVEGRDYRSANDIPDGPDKTIWGAEQKAWFKKSVSESTATWKVLVSPTPLVGPDRTAKNDNLSNAGFKHEGDELRGWLKSNAPGLVVVCGDRHWQYHSVHPETGLHELSVGPASDEHAGGSPGRNDAYHKFHRVKGGFLSGVVKRDGDKPMLTFTLHDVDGKQEYVWSAA
ncbi:MAG: alkaline phosphatase [Phycisphaerales bacterium]|nr:alkaline phosphatase [Phycisphaerales bacterium]